MIILYDFHIFDKIFWRKVQMFFPTIKKGELQQLPFLLIIPNPQLLGSSLLASELGRFCFGLLRHSKGGHQYKNNKYKWKSFHNRAKVTKFFVYLPSEESNTLP